MCKFVCPWIKTHRTSVEFYVKWTQACLFYLKMSLLLNIVVSLFSFKESEALKTESVWSVAERKKKKTYYFPRFEGPFL